MKQMKQAVVIVAMIIALALVSDAQISVPHTFTTTVPVSQVNTNFSTIADGALKRNGGNITGNITADSGITVDGVDISAALGGSGAGTFATVDISNTGAESLDVSGGAEFGTSHVELIGTDGRLKALSTTYLADLSGANLTGIVSTGLTTTRTTPSFSAGNYTASGTMTWTVAAGDVNHNSYVDIGTTMLWSIGLFNTSTSGTGASEFRITLPASRTVAANSNGACSGSESTTARNPLWSAVAGSTYVIIYKDDVATVWTSPVTDTTTVRCQMMIFF